MNSFYFTNTEIIIIILLIVIFYLPLRLISKKNSLSIVNPLLIHNLIIIYYSIISPIFRVITNQTIDRGIDFRNVLIYGWLGTLISSISLYIGYFLTPNILKKYRECNLNYERLWLIGFYLTLFGFAFNLITFGFDLTRFNPFIQGVKRLEFLQYRGAVSNYFLYLQNLTICGSLLMITSYLRTRKRKILTFSSLFITTGLLLNTGFRNKLFFLLFPLFLFYSVTKKFRPKIYSLFLFLGIISIGLLNSFLEIIRTYNGFNLKMLSKVTFNELILKFFQTAESAVFLTTSGLMSIIPEKVKYIYLYPIYKVIIHPIPSRFLPNKNPGDYIVDSITVLLGDLERMGAAIHNFGEYYLMFGWIGIIIMSLFLGFLLKKLWLWILIHYEEPIALPLYCLNVSYIFMIISRGYLPQQVQLYIFTVFPLTLIYLLNSKKLRNFI